MAFRHAYLAPEMSHGYPGPIWRARVSRRYFAEIQTFHEYPWAWFWALEEKASETVIGLADVSLSSCTPGAVRIGYGVFARHRRQGYATETVEAIIEAFGGHGGVESIVARFDPMNIASRGVLERCGFREKDVPSSNNRQPCVFSWERDPGAPDGPPME